MNFSWYWPTLNTKIMNNKTKTFILTIKNTANI